MLMINDACTIYIHFYYSKIAHMYIYILFLHPPRESIAHENGANLTFIAQSSVDREDGSVIFGLRTVTPNLPFLGLPESHQSGMHDVPP